MINQGGEWTGGEQEEEERGTAWQGFCQVPPLN